MKRSFERFARVLAGPLRWLQLQQRRDERQRRNLQRLRRLIESRMDAIDRRASFRLVNGECVPFGSNRPRIETRI